MMHRRHGSMLLEVSLAVMLLTVALVGVAQLLAVAARQRQETRRRSVATREVANVTEQVMALPWAETTSAQVATITLPPDARALLRDATLEVDLNEVTEPRAAKRIRVSLGYRNQADQRVTPITLVAWKFLPGGDQ